MKVIKQKKYKDIDINNCSLEHVGIWGGDTNGDLQWILIERNSLKKFSKEIQRIEKLGTNEKLK
jgi:hypothetical protein